MLGRLFAAVGLAGNKPTTTSVPAGEYGWHVLTIDGYSNVKAVVGPGKFVRTRTFTVGGHRWYINYFPNGQDADSADYITLYLMREQDAGGVDVSGRFKISLVDHDHDADSVPWPDFDKYKVHTWKADGSSAWACRLYYWSSLLERSSFLRDDCIRFRCDISIVSNEITTAERDDGGVEVPPPDVGLDILQLLWEGDGSDVSFEVAGETFRAHSYILAARSPVFMAEFYGPMKETTGSCVRIDDMEPKVFRLLLDFIYTDWVPELDEGVMSQHLLVAADRYGLERLKLICEHNLCCRINVNTVATTLALAEQHGCQGLKKACVQFLRLGRNLKAAMATDGFEHLTSSYPNVLEELLAMVAP